MSNPEFQQVPSDQFTATSGKKADKSTLAKGCAIGCGVLIVLGIFGGIGAVFVGRSFMGKMGAALSERLVEDFAVMKDTGQVPEEHAALYQEVVDLTARPETTVTAALVASTVVRTSLDDGQVDATERQEVEATRDFLTENPEAGVFATDQFLDEHPDLKKRVEEAQRTLNPATLLGPK